MQRIFTLFVLLTFQFCAFAQNWMSVGTRKMNTAVDQIYSDTTTNTLYATGWFWQIDTNYAYGLAQLDSTEWENTLANPVNNAQKRIVQFQGEIYVSKSPYLFRWNGISWDTVAIAGGIQALYNDGDSVLYMMGNFGVVNSMAISFIAKYDGSSWSAIDTTVWDGGAAMCAYRFQGDMYFGGAFYNTTNGIWRIARWDGSAWHAVGGGVTGSIASVGCMEEYNGELYVGGYMATAQGNPGDYIARWDGSNWTQVGGGMWGGQVFDLQVFGNDLWAAGQFIYAGGVSATCIARYDGLDWCSVGLFDNAITSIAIHDSELYVAGGFWTVDGDSVNKVVKWIGGSFADSCGHFDTGIEQNDFGYSVSVFPNPSTTITTFEFSGISGLRQLVITDQLGREIWRRETSDTVVQFPASEFASGMYFYTILENDQQLSQGKFLIAH